MARSQKARSWRVCLLKDFLILAFFEYRFILPLCHEVKLAVLSPALVIVSFLCSSLSLLPKISQKMSAHPLIISIHSDVLCQFVYLS